MPDKNLKDTGDIKCTRMKHKANRGLRCGPHLSRNCGVVRANDDKCGRNISTLQTAQMTLTSLLMQPCTHTSLH